MMMADEAALEAALAAALEEQLNVREGEQLYSVMYAGFSGGIIVSASTEQAAIDMVADPRHGLTVEIDADPPITITMRTAAGELEFLGDQRLTADEVEAIMNEAQVRAEVYQPGV